MCSLTKLSTQQFSTFETKRIVYYYVGMVLQNLTFKKVKVASKKVIISVFVIFKADLLEFLSTF